MKKGGLQQQQGKTNHFCKPREFREIGESKIFNCINSDTPISYLQVLYFPIYSLDLGMAKWSEKENTLNLCYSILKSQAWSSASSVLWLQQMRVYILSWKLCYETSVCHIWPVISDFSCFVLLFQITTFSQQQTPSSIIHIVIINCFHRYVTSEDAVPYNIVYSLSKKLSILNF